MSAAPRAAEFRCDVPTLERLAPLISAPLPLGLVVRGQDRALVRDVYLDTADNALATRNIACRVRFGADDRRTLTLSLAELGVPGSGPSQVFGADVAAVDLSAILASDTDPARRRGGAVDLARLESRFELEIDRVVRTASRPWYLPGRFAFLYDRVTVRSGGLVREFQELKVRRLASGRPRLEELALALEQGAGLRPVLQTKLVRARGLLRQMGQERIIRNLDSGRAVAVLALDGRAVALVGAGEDRRLPVTDGAGEQAVRHGLAEWFGSKVADVSLLGRSPPTLDRPSLEVWVARRLRRGLARSDGPVMTWIPVDELARAVREATLRDQDTLAAFAVAARSRLFPELAADGAMAARPEAPPEAVPADLLDPAASQLEFNVRVLAVAEDERTPLLERLRYLAIVSGNLDELYMGGADEVPAARAEAILERQRVCIERCLAELAVRGHRIRGWAGLTAEEREVLRTRFRREFFPVLTPRAITMSPGHPFPLIPSLTLSMAVALQGEATGPLHFAYVRLPSALPRFVELPDGDDLVPIEEIVTANLGTLYPGRRVEEVALFRVTRAGDLELEEAGAGDLLQAIEEELDQRTVKPVVRLELQPGISEVLRSLLTQELRFETGHDAPVGELIVQETAGLMAPGDLRRLTSLPVPGGLFPAFAGRDPIGADASLWARLRAGDLLLHHPYDDFATSVLRMLQDAAADPDVVALKMTLYRAGESSPVVEALIRAAEAGKEVAVFVELKASYDEARNIGWVKQLERAGAQVVYGLVGLKNHAKVALVVRREDGQIRRYVHVGTGNYNAATSRLYTDLGLLSADPALGDDLSDLFNQLTGSSRAPGAALRRLLVAPEHLLPGLLERIGREAAVARAGRPARIRAKLNGLDDPEVIRALYDASRAGVEIDLLVRGLCTLKPGVAALSERIRVRSIVGRFLEHARIYHFGNDGADEYLIGSADWRSRNLRRRVEVLASVLDPGCRARLDAILTRELDDPSAWVLAADGSYHQAHALPIGDPATAQARATVPPTPAAEKEPVWTG
ncbi:MAG: polyphosphate kinase 1 [Gemmatimonadales bacterium]